MLSERMGRRAVGTSGVIAVLLLASACGTPPAKRIDCDGTLEPINVPAPRSAFANGMPRVPDEEPEAP